MLGVRPICLDARSLLSLIVLFTCHVSVTRGGDRQALIELGPTGPRFPTRTSGPVQEVVDRLDSGCLGTSVTLNSLTL